VGAVDVTPEMIVGIDASYSMSGIAMVDFRSMKPIYSAVVREHKSLKDEPIYSRAGAMAAGIFSEALHARGVVLIGVEGPAPMAKITMTRRNKVTGEPEEFTTVNTKTIEQLARLRQAIHTLLRPRHGPILGPEVLDYFEPTPNQVKKAATGKGNAKKDHVVHSVRAWIRGANPEMYEIMSKHKNRLEAMTDAFGVALATAALYNEKRIGGLG